MISGTGTIISNNRDEMLIGVWVVLFIVTMEPNNSVSFTVQQHIARSFIIMPIILHLKFTDILTALQEMDGIKNNFFNRKGLFILPKLCLKIWNSKWEWFENFNFLKIPVRVYSHLEIDQFLNKKYINQNAHTFSFHRH